jgi:hypothetical protein
VTLAGLAPMIGLSEAGVAVASNELRVRDGTTGLFTSNLLAAMLTAPGIDDAMRRGQTGPRHGGAAIHGLAANGERFSLELSGQIAAKLSDPMLNSPRVHTNHPLDETIMPAITGSDGTSKLRLEQTASQAVGLTGITPTTIAGWFGFGPERKATSRIEVDSERVPISLVLAVVDPAAREMHLRRSGAPGALETIKL